MPEEKIFYKVYKHGFYYNPANRHYGGPGEVGCDRCLKEDIAVCIGWGDFDLCLDCCAEINEKYENGDLVVVSDSE